MNDLKKEYKKNNKYRATASASSRVTKSSPAPPDHFQLNILRGVKLKPFKDDEIFRSLQSISPFAPNPIVPNSSALPFYASQQSGSLFDRVGESKTFDTGIPSGKPSKKSPPQLSPLQPDFPPVPPPAGASPEPIQPHSDLDGFDVISNTDDDEETWVETVEEEEEEEYPQWIKEAREKLDSGVARSGSESPLIKVDSEDARSGSESKPPSDNGSEEDRNDGGSEGDGNSGVGDGNGSEKDGGMAATIIATASLLLKYAANKNIEDAIVKALPIAPAIVGTALVTRSKDETKLLDVIEKLLGYGLISVSGYNLIKEAYEKHHGNTKRRKRGKQM